MRLGSSRHRPEGVDSVHLRHESGRLRDARGRLQFVSGQHPDLYDKREVYIYFS